MFHQPPPSKSSFQSAVPGLKSPEKPARLLIVNWRCPKNPGFGGAEVHLHEIARRLVTMGHPVTVVTSGFRSASASEWIDGVSYRRVGNEISFLWQHRRVVKQCFNQDDFDLVIDDISKLPLAIHRRVNAPTLAWCHHIHGQSLYRQMAWPIATLIDRWEKQLPSWYANTPVLAVSESTRSELIRLGLPADRVGYVHDAVDVSAIQGMPLAKANHPLLLYLGRLQPYKNVDCVLRAFKRIQDKRPDAELAIIGQGPDEPRLRRLAERLGLTGVTFHGYVSEEAKRALLHQAWLSLASSSKEGWGICVLEANAAATPVIASNVPGHRDAIRNGRTGLLYPFDDDRTLAEMTLRCIKDRRERESLKDEALRWASRFSWDRSVQELLRWTAHFHPRLRPKLTIAEQSTDRRDSVPTPKREMAVA